MTGIGFDVNTNGGSFFGKNVSLKFWESESQSDGTESFIRRFSSGSGSAFCGGLNSNVAIMLPESLVLSQKC